MKDFKDVVFYDNEKEKVICYRSGLSVYEEKSENGIFMAQGRNGAGFMLNVLDDMPTRFGNNDFSQPQSFDFMADGYSLSGTWRFVSFDKETIKNENGIEILVCKVVLESSLKPIRVTVVTELDGTEFINRYWICENLSDKNIAISNISVAGGGLEVLHGWNKYDKQPDYNQIYELAYPEECRWGHEGMFKWHPLKREGTYIPGRFLCERYRHPMFILRNKLTGSVFISQLEFTGGYSFDFYLDVCENDSYLSWKAKLDGCEPYIVLKAKEQYTVPSVHMGYMQCDTDDAINTMHKHLRQSVFTYPDANGLYGIISGGMGPERVMDFNAIKHGVDTFAELGAKTMIVDAGWYCKAGEEVHEWHNYTGNWHPDNGKHPNGLKEVSDYIHSKGLIFGLWLDIECAGAKSDVRNSHPEWMIKDKFGNITNVLDFTNPIAAKWAEDELSRVISEYSVELFRLDNNTYFRNFHNLIGDNFEGVYSRYYQAVYAMYDRLRQRFPNVLFENCAGGGGRTDLGLVKYFSHSWVSDWQKMPRGVAITNGMTVCLPPEYVDRLFGGMESHIIGSLPIILRHTLFGKPTVNILNPVGSQYNEQQLEFVKHTLKLYDDFVHPFVKNSLIYHHTLELFGEETIGDCIIERCSEEKDRSIIGVFRLGGKPENKYVVVYPKGIKPEGTYEIYFDNSRAKTVVNGYEIVNNGIRVNLDCALTSELILIKRV